MTDLEIKNLQDKYENILKEKIEGKTFHVSESIQLVSIIGNEFASIASGMFGIKEFHLQQDKESYVNTLTYKIFCMEHKIADIIISVSEPKPDSLTMEEVMCDFKINEEMLEILIKEIKQKQLQEIENKVKETPNIEFVDLEQSKN